MRALALLLFAAPAFCLAQDNFFEFPRIKVDAEILEQMLARYRKLGLPFPPKDAQLVVTHEWEDEEGRPTQLDTGFLLKTLDKNEMRYLLFQGTRVVEKRLDAEPRPLELTANNAKRLMFRSFDWEGFGQSNNVVVALAMADRGQKEFALAALQDLPGFSEEGFLRYSFHPETALEGISVIALGHWQNVLLGDTDRTEVLKSLELLYKEEPNPKFREVCGELLQSVQATVSTPTAAPGTAEHLIDSLMALRQKDSARLGGHDWVKADERHERLVQGGFAVVPALIGHLGDRRLTRCLQPAHMNAAPYILEVGHVCRDLLTEYMLPATPADTHLPWQPKELAEEANKWWAEASKMGEEAYLLKYLQPKLDTGRGWIPPSLVYLLAHKYPHHLAKLAQAHTRAGSPSVHQFTTWLERVSKADARLVALEGARSLDLAIRVGALNDLEELDREVFEVALLATLRDYMQLHESYEKRVSAEREKHELDEDWARFALSHHPATRLGALCLSTTSKEAWQLLEKNAKTFPANLRAETVLATEHVHPSPQVVLLHKDFLRAFLQDTSLARPHHLPDDMEDSDGAFERKPIQVRQLAAAILCSLEGLPVPQQTWTDEQWEKCIQMLRERIGT